MLVEKSGKKIVLLLLLAFSFVYRFLLMVWRTFPPGSDTGLHESVIKSITVGETDLFFNYYHMGGGTSATNPGYHIFVVFTSALTGAPDYLVHTVVAAFFSAVTVLCVFLVVRRIWSESASFVAAFLAAFSTGDISMLSWGGYPNTVALMLIPIVFYLYLHRSRFPLEAYLTATSLLIGAIFLTHVFSAFVFAAITILTLFVSAILSKKTRLSVRQAVSWLLPIVFGAILVSPYLFAIVPVYFSPEGTITGTVLETKQTLLETRLVPIEVVCLSFIPVFLFFVFSRFYKGKYLTTSAILFASWILVPAFATQSFLFGFYLDYERFQYFLFFPLIVFVALLIESVSRVLSQRVGRSHNLPKEHATETRTGWLRKTPKAILARKVVYSMLVIVFVLFSLFCTPLLTAPDEALDDASFYQVMTPSKYTAIQWIKAYTPTDAVLVSNAEYGWWLSGFSQRPTLSAVDPKFLILAHEIEPAAIAKNLLMSDYFIDNGILQVNYYEAHAGGNNFEVSARLDGSYVLHPVLSVKDTEISLLYRLGGSPQHLSFAQFPVTDMQVRNGSNWASFQITMENQVLVFTESITIYTGVRFAKVSMSLQSKVEGVAFDWLHVPFLSRGAPTQYGNSIGFVDSSVNSLSQMIFPEHNLGTGVVMQENPDFFELVSNLEGKSAAQMEFFVGLCSCLSSDNMLDGYLQELMANNSMTYFDSVSDQPLAFFDYQKAIDAWNVSYVVVTSSESVLRFAVDPLFSLVYKNNEVAIFRVSGNPK